MCYKSAFSNNSTTAILTTESSPDVRARLRIVGLDAVVGGVAHAGDREVGVPGRYDRVEHVDVPAVPAQVENLRVGGLDPQGVTVSAGRAAVELRQKKRKEKKRTKRAG